MACSGHFAKESLAAFAFGGDFNSLFLTTRCVGHREWQKIHSSEIKSYSFCWYWLLRLFLNLQHVSCPVFDSSWHRQPFLNRCILSGKLVPWDFFPFFKAPYPKSFCLSGGFSTLCLRRHLQAAVWDCFLFIMAVMHLRYGDKKGGALLFRFRGRRLHLNPFTCERMSWCAKHRHCCVTCHVSESRGLAC